MDFGRSAVEGEAERGPVAAQKRGPRPARVFRKTRTVWKRKEKISGSRLPSSHRRPPFYSACAPFCVDL